MPRRFTPIAATVLLTLILAGCGGGGGGATVASYPPTGDLTRATAAATEADQVCHIREPFVPGECIDALGAWRREVSATADSIQKENPARAADMYALVADIAAAEEGLSNGDVATAGPADRSATRKWAEIKATATGAR